MFKILWKLKKILVRGVVKILNRKCVISEYQIVHHHNKVPPSPYLAD